ncbi:MAG: carbohydrate ABC transporter permease [Treponema sp.]
MVNTKNVLKKHASSRIRETPFDNTFNLINNIFLGLCFIAVLYPLVYIVSCSLSNPKAVIEHRVTFYPVDFDLASYKAVFANKDIGLGYLNSIIYVMLGTFVSVSLSMLLAYPLSRKEFYGRKFVTKFIMVTMLFSGGLIPLYFVVRNVGLYNTRWALVLPNAVNVWNVIIARTFLQETITNELYDAAQIDGCSDLRFFFTVVIPLSGAIIAVLSLFYAVVLWNSYFDALVFLQDKKLYPLQIVLRNILIVNKTDPTMLSDVSAAARVQGLAETIKYALIVVASLPLLILYPFVQKHFVKGVMIGSVKG